MTFDAKRHSRWIFGGFAGSVSVVATYPLDVLKVLLQTHTHTEKESAMTLIRKVVKKGGYLVFYKGLWMAICKQYTFNLTRFGIYVLGDKYISNTFTHKVYLSGFAGFIGGIASSPSEMVTLRIQNDVKLPRKRRRNYKNTIDGVTRIYKEEGYRVLLKSAPLSALRGSLMSIGQIGCYEQTKCLLLDYGYKHKKIVYIISSVVSGVMATLFTQPLDVLKTRAMNAPPNMYRNVLDVFVKTAKEGPLAFYKGFLPAFAKLGPNTVITFLTLEYCCAKFDNVIDSFSKQNK